MLRHSLKMYRSLVTSAVPKSVERQFINNFRILARASYSTNPRFVVNDSIPTYTPSRLAGRPYLPGSNTPNFPEFLGKPSTAFPLVLTPEESDSKVEIDDWAMASRKEMDNSLENAGAILFRGLPLTCADDFSKFVDHLGFQSLKYRGGAGRRHQVADYVMTASNEPREFTIDLHTEMSNLGYWPSKLLFFCERAPEPNNGGETPFAKMDSVLKNLDPALLEKLQRKGVRYYRNLCDKSVSSYQSWQHIMMTSDRKEVEAFCVEQGYEFIWQDDNSLTYFYTLPATIKHPKTGKELWFNQISSHHASYFFVHPEYLHESRDLMKYPFHTSFGDGEEFSEEEMSCIRIAQWKEAVGFHWQEGDVVVLDNLTTAHARIGTINESKRKILASLLD
ncbi:dapdiamide synthesis protein DdaC-like [Saccoglossus kowalevskii]|uniref:Clavaminate synthase-like protein At3g21360-like n=1 Tax=Saccoglossus kowalevskii TaxID=10224 RepID=A0ABM0M7I7_SACKO|nr:PREDICTED: clavaminate synthase-like protein At3g21360-like [Saccoglossus kowalevskii]